MIKLNWPWFSVCKQKITREYHLESPSSGCLVYGCPTNSYWLVVSTYPSEKIMEFVRLGWWHSQYMEKIVIKFMFQTTNQINNLQILGFSKYIMEHLQVIKHVIHPKTPNDVKPVELLQNGFPMYSSTTGFWKQLSSGCSLKIPSWIKLIRMNMINMIILSRLLSV